MVRDREKVKNLKKNISGFFSKQKTVAAVILFGSFGTEYETKFSDIDLGIIFMPDVRMDLKRELEMDANLSLFMGTDRIDLVNLNKAPLQLRFEAITSGDLIFEQDYETASDFIENTYRYYLDYAYDLHLMKMERDRALKEAYGRK